MVDATIIIQNYNGLEILQKCLPSVVEEVERSNGDRKAPSSKRDIGFPFYTWEKVVKARGQHLHIEDYERHGVLLADIQHSSGRNPSLAALRGRG